MASRSTKKRRKCMKGEEDEESTADGPMASKNGTLAVPLDSTAGTVALKHDKVVKEEGSTEGDDLSTPTNSRTCVRRRPQGEQRKSYREIDPLKGNLYSLKSEFRDKAIGWNICDTCGQATSVELPYKLAKPTDKWYCGMNVWNPAMSKCCTEAQWEEIYQKFMETRKKKPREWIIQGKKINKWWLYNTITQLGGWETVKYNGWLPLLYEELALTASDAGNRFKHIYEKDLLEFEQWHFTGKRYDQPQERAKLFREAIGDAEATSPVKKEVRNAGSAQCLPADNVEMPVQDSSAPKSAATSASHRTQGISLAGMHGRAMKVKRGSGTSVGQTGPRGAALTVDGTPIDPIVCGHDYCIISQSGTRQQSYPVVYRSRGIGYCGRWSLDKELKEPDMVAKVNCSQKAWIISRMLTSDTVLTKSLLLDHIIALKSGTTELGDAGGLEKNLDGTLKSLEAEGILSLEAGHLQLCDIAHATCSVPLYEPCYSKSLAKKSLQRLPHFQWQGRDLLKVAYISGGHQFSGVLEMDTAKYPKQGMSDPVCMAHSIKAAVVNYLVHCEGFAADEESVVKAVQLLCVPTTSIKCRKKEGKSSASSRELGATASNLSAVDGPTAIHALAEENVLLKLNGSASSILWQVNPHHIDLLVHAVECNQGSLCMGDMTAGVQEISLGRPASYGSLVLCDKERPSPSGETNLAASTSTSLWVPEGEVVCTPAGEIFVTTLDHGVVFAIDCILGHGVRASDGATFFRIKWKGLSEEEATWESEHSLRQTAAPLIDFYYGLHRSWPH